MFRRLLAGAAGVLATLSCASAHITLEQQQAPVASSYKAVMRVPHGCEGAAERPYGRAGGRDDDDIFHRGPSVDGCLLIAARKMPRTRALVNSGKNIVVFQSLD